MKYLVFVLKTLVLLVFQLLMTVVGMLILPLFLKRVEEFECTNETSRPALRFKDKWIDAVFGNIEDGVDGDIYYRRKYEKLDMKTRYNWVAIRNTIHNLALSMGVNEVISSYVWAGNRYTEDRVGKEGWCYSEAIGESGKVYMMFRWCQMFKISEIVRNIMSFIAYTVMYVYTAVRTKHLDKFSYTYLRNVGIECFLGYKNFNIKEVGVLYKYSFTVSINPIKKFEN